MASADALAAKSKELTDNRWIRVKEILGTALELKREARLSFVAEACGNDAGLREEVETLLASSEEADDFIEKPALSRGDEAPRVEDPDALIDTRLGNYKIVQFMGEGGMGVVYRAIRDEGDFHLQVAIKVVKRGMDSKAILRRFREERRILARLDHPNIAKLLDGGITPDGRPYFVMEFLEGTPIHIYCQTHDLNLGARLSLFLAACDAVEYSHRNLVVHRDLKATNILVSSSGVPKLLDFGIAKLMDRDSTTSDQTTVHGERLMTPDYASPEQIRGEALTTSTDVYSLGVLLFELTTGRRPFQMSGIPHHEMARLLATTDTPRPSAVGPKQFQRDLAGDLDTIIQKAMHRTADRRYTSVQQFAADIRRHLAGKPVLAQPDRWTYRASKFLTRNKAGVSLAVAGTLIIFALATAVAWQSGVAEAKNREAQRRFSDLRSLANSFLGELDGELDKLPGSTPAREILASKVLIYLDRLARDDIQDKSLQRELATAYERLGDVQGGPRSSNLGNSAAALESYGKALRILDGLATNDPGNPQLALDLANGYSKMSDLLSLMGEHRRALEKEQKALAVREAWLSRNPAARQAKRALAASLQDVAGGMERLGQYTEALEKRRRALALLEELNADGPGDSNLRLALALANKRLGRSLSRQRKFPEALTLFDRAMAIEKAEVESGTSKLVAQTNLGFTHDDKGVALTSAGEYGPALECLREALAVRTRLAQANPKDVRAASLLAGTQLHLGVLEMRRGRPEGAIPLVRASLESREALSARDPKNAGAKAEVAEAMGALGEAHLAGGDRGNAKRWIGQAVERYSELRSVRGLSAEYEAETDRLGRLLARL